MNVQRSALLPYSAAQMYHIVKDVRAYPEFLQWCTDVVMHEESETSQTAELKINYGRLRFSFTTSNILVEGESLAMTLVSGPFKDLSGQWVLEPLGEAACKVSLQMNFTFDNPITHRLFGRVFKSVVGAQVDAFESRADLVYGKLI